MLVLAGDKSGEVVLTLVVRDWCLLWVMFVTWVVWGVF